MIIYGEFLFAENYIIGLLLLLLTGKLTGRLSLKSSSKGGVKVSSRCSGLQLQSAEYRQNHETKHCRKKCISGYTRAGSLARILLASAACGAGGFVIFLPLTGLGSVAFRIITGLICIILAFGLKNLLQATCLFYILTFASGGMVMALLLWMQEPAITHQGIIYIEAITYLKLMCFGVLAFGLTYWFVKFIKSHRLEVTGVATIVIGDKHFEFKAYVDSGNSLQEPISGRPAVLADKKAVKTMNLEGLASVSLYDGADGEWQHDGVGDESLYEGTGDEWSSFSAERYAVIPYHSVGTEFGYLEAVRADRIVFCDKCVENPYIAFYEGDFQGYNVLLNKDFLEGRA